MRRAQKPMKAAVRSTFCHASCLRIPIALRPPPFGAYEHYRSRINLETVAIVPSARRTVTVSSCSPPDNAPPSITMKRFAMPSSTSIGSDQASRNGVFELNPSDLVMRWKNDGFSFSAC